MYSKAATPDEYFRDLLPEQQEVLIPLRQVISDNLPAGFEEAMNSSMPGWAVPLFVYPAGYHATGAPLPFISIAAQKTFFALYHMGLVIPPGEALMKWFRNEYERSFGKKLDAGKSCLRFRKFQDVPYDLIGELARKISPQEYAAQYALFDPRNKIKNSGKKRTP